MLLDDEKTLSSAASESEAGANSRNKRRAAGFVVFGVHFHADDK
jgi:hypothetical protein